VLSEIEPTLYVLKDLMGDKVPGFYYSAQLIRTSEPKSADYQLVEKILDTKIVKNVKYVLVKFLFYPGAFLKYSLLVK